jgi:small subunit ribosomal protein S20
LEFEIYPYMPVTKSAKKALRRDIQRESVNKPIRTRMRKFVRVALDEPSSENIAAAYSSVDRAAKKKVIHANRAARLKSRLMKAAQGNKRQ